MTNNEIVTAVQPDIKKIIGRLLNDSRNPFDFPEDLLQDINIILLTKDNAFLNYLYERKQLGYWLLRVVRNQLLSRNSPYYCTYIKRGIHDNLDNLDNHDLEEDI